MNCPRRTLSSVLVLCILAALLFSTGAAIAGSRTSSSSSYEALNPDAATPAPHPNVDPTPGALAPNPPAAVSQPALPESRSAAASASAATSLEADRITLTLNPDASEQRQLAVSTGSSPIDKGDVMFVFDITGSMGDEIAQAKASAIQIMNGIQSQLPSAWFGVASFSDYPGSYSYPGYSAQYGGSGDTPWKLDIGITDNTPNVADAISNLRIGWGADSPEDYTRVLYELKSDTIGWRPNAKKMVVLFGDAPTHDLTFAGYNFGGDPGPDAIAGTSDDLYFVPVVQQLEKLGITVIAVDSGNTPESAATLKGMSVGYASAPGTHGQYYQLSDTSQIPTAVVNLIKAETTHVDRLWLKVTEGYKNWTEIQPPDMSNVDANKTVTFTVTFKVPAGTAPGYYPFMIQAIGDGVILKVFYIDITVPTSSPISDLGFRPYPDGFSFTNYGTKDSLGRPEPWFRTLSWDMFRHFFGTPAVEYSNGNHIRAADEYYTKAYQFAAGDPRKAEGNGGVCDGMASTSMLNYRRLSQPTAGVYAFPQHSRLHDKAMDGQIRDAVAFAQGIQTGVEVGGGRSYMCTVDKSPASFYRWLKSQIQNNSPVVLSIAWDDMKLLWLFDLYPAGAHTLLPYRFEEPSPDKAYVYVYDPNKPRDSAGGSEDRVEFDLSKDTWQYDLVDLWFVHVITVHGDAKKCQLWVTPLEAYRHEGVPWWMPGTASSSVGSTTAQLFTAFGPARLLFTDDQGRRLGWDGTVFYDEILGAGYLPGSTGSTATAPGVYYIPDDVRYDLTVHGYGGGMAAVGAWRAGSLVEFSDFQVMTGTIISLAVARDGTGVSVIGGNTGIHGTLSVSRKFLEQDRAVMAENIDVDPGEEVSLHFAATDTVGISDSIKLSTTSSVSKVYDLAMQRTSGSGYSAFGHSGLAFDANSEQVISISDWSDLGTVNVSVDLGRDGTIDKSVMAANQAVVNSVSLEASPTILYTGGEQAQIIVTVKDQFGAYVADGTPVHISTSLGSLSASNASTSGGFVRVTLTTGAQAGTAIVIATAGSVSGETPVIVSLRHIYLTFLEK